MRWVCRTLRAAGSTAALMGILVATMLGAGNATCLAQQPAGKEAVASPGDQPNDPGPLASDLAPALHAKPIRAAMKKVADWELARVEAQPPSRAWDFGALDIGLMAASRTLHDPRYRDYVASVGDHFGWTLERTTYPANDFAISQAFIEVYRSSHKEEQIAPLRRQYDDAVALLNDPEKPAWWWCDALFMAPAAGVEMSDITGDDTYNAYVDREWGKTEKILYDKQKHLFSRDANYLNKHEKNGEKIFWSRGQRVGDGGAGARAGDAAIGRSAAAALRCAAAGDGGGGCIGAGKRWLVAAGAAGCGELSAARGVGVGVFHICDCVGHRSSHAGRG